MVLGGQTSPSSEYVDQSLDCVCHDAHLFESGGGIRYFGWFDRIIVARVSAISCG